MSTTATVEVTCKGLTKDFEQEKALCAKTVSITSATLGSNEEWTPPQKLSQRRTGCRQTCTNTTSSPSPPLPKAPLTFLTRQKSNRRHRDSTPLPEGEHNVAARSRIRRKSERRRSRSSHQRSEVNPTQSMRSPRRRDSSASVTIQSDISSNKRSYSRRYNDRFSSPLPPNLSYSNLNLSADDLKRLKQKNRRSSPLLTRLPLILGSHNDPLFSDLWLEERNRYTISIHERRYGRIFNSLLYMSPRNRFHKPTALTLPPKSEPIKIQNTNTTAHRKRRDVSNVPSSAIFFLRHLDCFGSAPYLISQLQVVRRPSTGNPWDIITPVTPLFQIHKRGESREGFHEEFRGCREFDGIKGFWSWSERMF